MANEYLVFGSSVAPLPFYTLSDSKSEQISGGRRGRGGDDAGSDRRSRSGRGCQPGQLGSLIGGFGSQSFGSLMSVNVFQLNLAINLIFGGNGNSILNMQGNQLSGV
jgi:hypothetical protein